MFRIVDTLPSRRSATLTLTLMLGLALATGCQSNKMNGGNSQTNGNGNQASGSGGGSQKGGSNAGGSQKGGGGQNAGGSGGASHELAEPSESTTGVPSGPVAAASDDGSPQAVGHTSTAMPGAPQATLNGKQQQDKALDSPESQSKPRVHPQ